MRIEIIVVFPAPFCPSRHVICPSNIPNVTPESATTGLPFAVNVRPRLSMLTTSAPGAAASSASSPPPPRSGAVTASLSFGIATRRAACREREVASHM